MHMRIIYIAPAGGKCLLFLFQRKRALADGLHLHAYNIYTVIYFTNRSRGGVFDEKIVNEEYTRTNVQLVFACWQAWTWLSWPNWTVLLTVDVAWNRLFMAGWTNRLEKRCWNYYDGSTALFVHDRTRYNNQEHVTTTKDMLQQPWTWLLYQVGFCMF